MRGSERRAHGAEEATLQLVQAHAAELLRFARRFSHCADDAHDAYQRTLEILVRRMREEPPAHPLAWLRTVLRREALAVRRERERLVGRVELDLDRCQGRELDDPAERVVGHERLRHAAEALRRLKPQEVTALMLRAEGLSYHEISARTGWTYTRTNRAITEGRRALIARLGAIESGAECARWLPLLSALADGEATAAELVELRPHLRACPACRATLRECHAAPGRVAALVPAALVPLAAGSDGSVVGHVELALHGVVERMTLLAARVQGAFEALPAGKVAAVAASTAVLAGGGAALQQVPRQPSGSSGPVARVADAAPGAPSTGQLGLTTSTAPFPHTAPATSPAHRSRRSTASQREFASQSSTPSEFSRPAAPAAEFASVAPQASAAATPTPAPARPSSPRSSSEFGGP
jgi:RNA polymerase sigma factor (sigma-70 family)